MPLFELSTNVAAPESKDAILKALSAAAAKEFGKPETYVMVKAHFGEDILLGGTTEPAALVRLESIGKIDPESNQRYSESFCKLLEEHLGIPNDRVYLQMTDFPRANWGWNSKTFAS
eukprot:TRINITY_DN11473_c0_g2_i4.p3 TRINITY_DN11473_c0_g2~~TRINITY_DN11473_c0_g2_i4.p3  ORF type:complete len:117 (+),score=24.11 TRINITY_DN11473_c0_g2_i4:2277-2627(+)